MMNQEKITGKNQKNKLPFALNILYAKKKMNASYLFYSKKKKKMCNLEKQYQNLLVILNF